MPYDPAARKKRFQAGYKLSPNRVAWARICWGLVAMFRYEDEGETVPDDLDEGVQYEPKTEPGPTIRLIIKKNNLRRPVTLDLTMLTAAELRHLRQVMTMALDAAEPICQFRDEEAAKQHATGDDSNSRVYRPVSQFVAREGSSAEHIEGIRDRSSRVPGRDGTGDAGRRVRDESPVLAEPAPGTAESQDDES